MPCACWVISVVTALVAVGRCHHRLERRGRRGAGLAARGHVSGGVVALVGELPRRGDHERVEVRQVLDALERRVVVHRADDLDHAEDQGGDGRHGDDRDKPPAHAPVADREQRALARGRARTGTGRRPAGAGTAGTGRFAWPEGLPKAPSAWANAGSLTNGQRSALGRAPASVSGRPEAGVGGPPFPLVIERLRTALHTSQLQGPPGPAQGNSSS